MFFFTDVLYSEKVRQSHGTCLRKGSSGISSKKEKIFAISSCAALSSDSGAAVKPQLPAMIVVAP